MPNLTKSFDIFFQIIIFTKNFYFSRQISERFRFFQVISPKSSTLQGKFPRKISNSLSNFTENFNFLGNFTKNFDFQGKNWLFTGISGQIILVIFKSHHFRTYFLYIMRYNKMLRPIHDPYDHPSPCDPLQPHPPLPPAQNPDPQPPGLTPTCMYCSMFVHVF